MLDVVSTSTFGGTLSASPSSRTAMRRKHKYGKTCWVGIENKKINYDTANEWTINDKKTIFLIEDKVFNFIRDLFKFVLHTHADKINHP